MEGKDWKALAIQWIFVIAFSVLAGAVCGTAFGLIARLTG